MKKKSRWYSPPWLIVCHKIFIKNYQAMALYPFIVVKDAHLRHDAQLIMHERIHLRQQIELLLLPFYLLYGLHYLYLLCRLGSHWKAYQNICFEREAYSQECNPTYLAHRPFWAWIRYWSTPSKT